MKLKVTKNNVIATIVIIAILVAAFWNGGGVTGLQGWNISPPASDEIIKADEETNVTDSIRINSDYDDDLNNSVLDAKEENKSEMLEISKEENSIEKAEDELQGMVIDSVTGKDKYLTDPVPEGKPIPMEPQDSIIGDVEYTCTLSVRCDTVLDNIDWLDPEKVELVPEDGVIFARTSVTFYEGESVFNVLQREMKKAKIHMEFSNTPMYNSAYIEGINNLYEFDCGELSGWAYKVNQWFPNYGASRYLLKDGDVIEWLYTCDLGTDIGGYNAIGE